MKKICVLASKSSLKIRPADMLHLCWKAWNNSADFASVSGFQSDAGVYLLHDGLTASVLRSLTPSGLWVRMCFTETANKQKNRGWLKSIFPFFICHSFLFQPSALRFLPPSSSSSSPSLKLLCRLLDGIRRGIWMAWMKWGWKWENPPLPCWLSHFSLPLSDRNTQNCRLLSELWWLSAGSALSTYITPTLASDWLPPLPSCVGSCMHSVFRKSWSRFVGLSVSLSFSCLEVTDETVLPWLQFPPSSSTQESVYFSPWVLPLNLDRVLSHMPGSHSKSSAGIWDDIFFLLPPLVQDLFMLGLQFNIWQQHFAICLCL